MKSDGKPGILLPDFEILESDANQKQSIGKILSGDGSSPGKLSGRKPGYCAMVS
jgi:hypothetical protein